MNLCQARGIHNALLHLQYNVLIWIVSLLYYGTSDVISALGPIETDITQA